ncbi:MAG: tryptophan synthase subunit alpha [Chloroflexi bacterium]|nr:tryptophan synthase subunit alpha [Chloroflexota bacterium]
MPELGQRYRAAFAASAERGDGPLLFPFLAAGFPTPAETPELVRAALRGGAAGFEIGVPFSDPLADGPVHQDAYNVALTAGATLETALDAVRVARAESPDAPLTLMGYLNPFLAHASSSDRSDRDPGSAVGEPLDALARRAAEAGVDGVIIVDLPVDESDAAREVLAGHGISLIYLLAPTSTPERIDAVARRASGFIYLLSLTGVTGARDQVARDLADFVGRVRARTDTPLAVGFGISRREHVVQVGTMVPAAIIGSALTATIASAPPGGRAAAVERYLEVVTGRRSETTGE